MSRFFCSLLLEPLIFDGVISRILWQVNTNKLMLVRFSFIHAMKLLPANC